MWRDDVTALVDGLDHPAWGRSHCDRTYRIALRLAEEDGVRLRDDVVFALAYLHDIGAFSAYASADRPQSESSARAAEAVLERSGYPSGLRHETCALIRAHGFDVDVPPVPEARYFHDADVLDFMGAVGMTRLLSIVGLEEWTPDVRSAVDVAASFAEDLPNKLVTRAAEGVARARQVEMLAYLASLRQETAELAEL